MPSTHLTIDLGASGGRIVAIGCDDDRLDLHVVHRFDNQPVPFGENLFWDHLAIWRQIQDGLTAAADGDVASIGVDSWGVDFLLLDAKDLPLSPGFCYRDNRNARAMAAATARVGRDLIAAETGIQFMQINSLYQLAAMRAEQPWLLDAARTFLMVADFYHFLLSGARTCEVTNASTTQLLRAEDHRWSEALCQQLDIPLEIFLPPSQPSQSLGPLTRGVADRTGLRDVPVVLPTTHDTAAAVLAVPVDDFANPQPRWAYISCGTWSLMGVELDRPVLTDRCRELNFTNEAGPGGTIRLLKNIAGLWPLQQVREGARRRGDTRSWDEWVAAAAAHPPIPFEIDLDDPALINPPDMRAAIAKLVGDQGRSLPDGDGGLARLLIQSLAARYAVCLGKLEQLLPNPIETIYLIGGGVQNELLCQLTADYCGRHVVAGEPEATAIGNAISQAIGVGRFDSVQQARQYLTRVSRQRHYQPAKRVS